MPKQTLLFDLGGVVVDYRGPERLAALSEGALSLEGAHAALASDLLHAFERGEVSPEQFAQGMVENYRLPVSPQIFIEEFETWPERFLPGAREAIEALRGDYRLACLSNINIPHWRRAEALDLPPLFERAFLSHVIGARKPEPEIFAHALGELGGPAEAIVFFDDVPANVEVGGSPGLKAHPVPPSPSPPAVFS